MKDFRPVKQEKTVISIRLNADTLDKVDVAAGKADISRNEFLVQCIEYALKNLG